MADPAALGQPDTSICRIFVDGMVDSSNTPVGPTHLPAATQWPVFNLLQRFIIAAAGVAGWGCLSLVVHGGKTLQ